MVLVRRLLERSGIAALCRLIGWAWWSGQAWTYRRQCAAQMAHSDAVAKRADVLRAKAKSARERADRLASRDGGT
jgi:hypothetical protein